MSLLQRYNTIATNITGQFDYQVIWKIWDGPSIGDIDVPELFAVVIDRIHDIDCQFQLIDTTTRACGIKLRIVLLRLLTIMRPVVAHLCHDILRSRGWFGLETGQDLVFKVVVLEVGVR